MSGFWRKWLTVWCWAVGVFGLVLLGGGFETTSGPTRLLFGFLNSAAPLDMDPPLRFSLAVMGAVTIGWSLTLAALIHAAILLGDRGRSIWIMLVGSVTCWFVIDTPMSIATGYGLNAIPNLVLYATLLLPIVRSGVLRKT